MVHGVHSVHPDLLYSFSDVCMLMTRYTYERDLRGHYGWSVNDSDAAPGQLRFVAGFNTEEEAKAYASEKNESDCKHPLGARCRQYVVREGQPLHSGSLACSICNGLVQVEEVGHAHCGHGGPTYITADENGYSKPVCSTCNGPRPLG